MVDKVMGRITDPKQMATYSSAGQIAEVVYEAVPMENGSSAIWQVTTQSVRSAFAIRTRGFPQGDLSRTESIMRQQGLECPRQRQCRRITVSEDH
jgi:hypothetical protein